MDRDDPITQFFPGEEEVDLYAVFSLSKTATGEEIRKSYRRLALVHHPDKHTHSSEKVKADAALKFQQVGFAYAVLSDDKRRKRYDQTGRTDEGFGDVDEDGWEAYFEDLFDRVTRGKLDELKKEYQNSSEEATDLKAAYIETDGDIGEIMNHIPHSTIDDEPRFMRIITELITSGDIPKLPTWEKSIKDEKARLVRKKQSDKEAVEAEKLAKELGVWDEFYGSGKTGQRRGKGKGKAAAAADEEEDTSALQALILKKKQKSMSSSFLDDLAAKYTEPPKTKGKGKKRGKAEVDEEEEANPRKRQKSVPDPPDIDDAEFAQIQERLMKGKGGAKEKAPRSKGKTRR
ncbi:hypothetical protein EV715DRAFT_277464 [Schizophyllum commune]